ncbi:hypothetical protein ABZ686_02315 [Streptomyces sp. NPDC006992]|uniref:hypothetical protein n=1 Tax=Streptomyces sp. NPDC006992 TaxID=3155601 RepID=UPI0033CF87EC
MAITDTRPGRTAGMVIPADWTAADFDSAEVLALLHVPDPIDCVTRARAPRPAEEPASERSAR